ncbi:MAG: phosphoribosyltransferase family protein [Chloroflexota bacterium]|nr:phosphoribosyltransferase family protein [Chloroflexota bacterium]MDP6509583.1 phosphoribosyltransferase family protein [Chloroflexota bacterium]MDP6757804.1 phosphoribosyltransferase family protein [Chloroflexota bacterium]
MSVDSGGDVGSLWLARTIYELGGIEFGSFTLGRSTIDSPIYLKPKVLISNPGALRTAASLIHAETVSRAAMRNPGCGPFDLVAGVPFGGLHIATSFSLSCDRPLIYVKSLNEDDTTDRIEGRFLPGQSVLIVDDLISAGGSMTRTAAVLRDAGLKVTDAVALVDREQGGAEELHRHGINLIPVLKMTTILNYYMAEGWISEANFRRSLDVIRSSRAD